MSAVRDLGDWYDVIRGAIATQLATVTAHRWRESSGVPGDGGSDPAPQHLWWRLEVSSAQLLETPRQAWVSRKGEPLQARLECAFVFGHALKPSSYQASAKDAWNQASAAWRNIGLALRGLELAAKASGAQMDADPEQSSATVVLRFELRVLTQISEILP